MTQAINNDTPFDQFCEKMQEQYPNADIKSLLNSCDQPFWKPIKHSFDETPRGLLKGSIAAKLENYIAENCRPLGAEMGVNGPQPQPLKGKASCCTSEMTLGVICAVVLTALAYQYGS